jgi:hypothetical protein
LSVGRGNNRVALVDRDTRHRTSFQTAGRTPDVLVYEPEHWQLYLGAEDGTVSVIREDFLGTTPGTA